MVWDCSSTTRQTPGTYTAHRGQGARSTAGKTCSARRVTLSTLERSTPARIARCERPLLRILSTERRDAVGSSVLAIAPPGSVSCE